MWIVLWPHQGDGACGDGERRGGRDLPWVRLHDLVERFRDNALLAPLPPKWAWFEPFWKTRSNLRATPTTRLTEATFTSSRAPNPPSADLDLLPAAVAHVRARLRERQRRRAPSPYGASWVPYDPWVPMIPGA